MTYVFDAGQFVFGFIAVLLAFIAGMVVGKERNVQWIDRREYDERHEISR